DTYSDTASDTITIQAPPLGVTTTKEANSTDVFVPREGDRPEVTFNLTAKLNSVTKATHLLVTDPPICGDTADNSECMVADPPAENPLADGSDLFAEDRSNPFDELDLTKISISQDQN